MTNFPAKLLQSQSQNLSGQAMTKEIKTKMTKFRHLDFDVDLSFIIKLFICHKISIHSRTLLVL